MRQKKRIIARFSQQAVSPFIDSESGNGDTAATDVREGIADDHVIVGSRDKVQARGRSSSQAIYLT